MLQFCAQAQAPNVKHAPVMFRFCACVVAASMFSKSARGDDGRTVPPNQRLERNLADLFLANQVSGKRAASLFQDVSAAGAAHSKQARDLGKVKVGGHASRDLLRKFARRSAWPSLYSAKVPCRDYRTEEETELTLPFLLPHEVLAEMARFSDKALLTATGGMEER